LAERELLALVLPDGSNGMSALDLAVSLLADYGSLEALGAARPEELATWPGVGPAKAAVVVPALRLGRKVDVSASERPVTRPGEREILNAVPRKTVGPLPSPTTIPAATRGRATPTAAPPRM